MAIRSLKDELGRLLDCVHVSRKAGTGDRNALPDQFLTVFLAVALAAETAAKPAEDALAAAHLFEHDQ